MQALVLAKSRCQSELLQTADRALAVAREAAALEATYEARKLEVDALQVRRFVRSAAKSTHPLTLLVSRRHYLAHAHHLCVDVYAGEPQ